MSPRRCPLSDMYDREEQQQAIALPDEPQGEAKDETVNPNSLESCKDLEVDGGDNSHELSIKIYEPKEGKDQEQAPPNVHYNTSNLHPCLGNRICGEYGE
ncbi:hypothetical protein QJS04_geneDACA013331 [Acorus gramineus]|uniref:Uncharacterized protein n=1 Tax=Acorus gramineus TaxID=55184 RepID=A0AAV9AA06_ACOGR|nr:hypothetical protein QJS04_geneDACA013331 [Acorus gramineus]